jgi:hypothetical protein
MAADVTQPPMNMGSASGFGKPEAPAKKEYSVEQKLACSIEAMRNGGECEACQ